MFFYDKIGFNKERKDVIMTIDEVRKFYDCDEKKYFIAGNKELLSWIKENLKQDYALFLSTQDMQDFVDNLTYWYNLKYPDREMAFYEGTKDEDFKNVKPLSQAMDFNQLRYHLSKQNLFILDALYRSSCLGVRNVYDKNNQVIGTKKVVCLQIDKKEELSYFEPHSFLITADCDTGKVCDMAFLKENIKDKDITLDELLLILERDYSEQLSFPDVKKCVYNHSCDVTLRNYLLQLVALKLLYSLNTTPERGYERAQRFLKEMNKKLYLQLKMPKFEKSLLESEVLTRKKIRF